MNKRTMSLLLAAIISFCLIGSLSHGTSGNIEAFTDVPKKHWAYHSIGLAIQHGIVNGYPDGTFRPGEPVKEAEFLAMLFRAYPEISVPSQASGEQWYEPYFSLGSSYKWPIWHETDGKQYDRGRVAQVVAASQGELLNTVDAVQYLLDNKLSKGKTSATVHGYGIADKLTRAEAVTFIENMRNLGLTLSEVQSTSTVPVHDAIQVRSIVIGESEASVIAKLGQPAHKALSEYGFYWYVYNQDYSNYVQVGIKEGKVVGLYTNSADWSTKEGILLGSSKANVRKLYGEGLEYILKGNTRYLINGKSKEESPVYFIEQSYVTFFLDVHEGNAVTAIQVIEQHTEHALEGFYGPPSTELRTSFELQLFELVNAIRVRFGEKILVWNDDIATVAREHSKDMSNNNYFDHNNLQGKDPFVRMDEYGISYSTASENIAGGSASAIYAHEGLMNSKGHRKNILDQHMSRLGVGVHIGGGDYTLYYTQNFYTPMQ